MRHPCALYALLYALPPQCGWGVPYSSGPRHAWRWVATR